MNLKLKTDLAGLKTTVNNLVVDKLKDCSRWFCKPSNVVNKDVVKKTVHDKLISKVIATDTEIPSHGALVTKTQYDSDKQDLEKKITDMTKSYLILVSRSKDWLQHKNYWDWNQDT